MPTGEELKILQNLPLDIKVWKTKQRIREWVNYFGEDGVYISFSGGKDSTVLLHIARELYPNMEAVYIDTGLEYPEIKSFIRTFDNVTILRPKMRFDEVIRKYGYPLIGKEVSAAVYEARNATRNGNPNNYRMKKFNGELMDKNGNKSQFNLEKWKPLLNMPFSISDRCCDVMKKEPSRRYGKEKVKVPITAQMTCESRLRRQQWLRHGCNAFDKKTPMSNPMSFWTEQDVLIYIKEQNLPIASVYGEIIPEESAPQKLKCTGCKRTGCVFCCFGITAEKDENRFERLRRTHPKHYDYCLNGGEYDPTDGLWKPSKDGLGMKYVFDKINEIYGQNFIRY